MKIPAAFRRQPPAARTVLITDGVQWTDQRTVGWTKIPGKARDWLTDDQVTSHTLEVARALPNVLGVGTAAHLKMVWSQLSSADYLAGMRAREIHAGRYEEFTAVTADRIDSLALPQLSVFLGRELTARNGSPVAGVKARVEASAGLSPSGVNSGEERALDPVWSQFAGRANRSALAAAPATAADIAWLLARERRTPQLWLPAPAGRLEGAGVARLMDVHVKPHPEYLTLTSGGQAAFVSVLVGADFEDLTLPGGEWLEWLSETPGVQADFSARLTMESTTAAVKKWRDIAANADEQIKSAETGSAGQAPEEMYETREYAREQVLRLRREGLAMVVSDPRWIVSAAGRDELEERVDVLTQFYSDRGVSLYRPAHQQKQLWLEQLPGDQARISEYYQYQPALTLAGSWFFGGAKIGDADGPFIGSLAGRHAGLVRLNVLDSARRGDATTLIFLGKSGSGKTTAIMLTCLDVAFGGAWVTLVDLKGDCGGLVDVAQDWDIPARLVPLGSQYAGVLCAFGYMPPQAAKTEATAQLLGMLPMGKRPHAERYVLAAAETVAQQPSPCTADIIDALCASGDLSVRDIGDELATLAKQGLAAPIAGRRAAGVDPLDTSRGVRVIQFPGRRMPRLGVPEANWGLLERLSMVAFRAATGYTTYVANSLRHMPKLVALPELHQLTATADGSGFVGDVARTGRALNTNLLIDSQVAVDVAAIEALKEQATFVFAFQADSPAEQTAIADMLGVEPTRTVRTQLAGLGPVRIGEDGIERKVKGHCVIRDRRGNVDTMHWDARTTAILDGLSTTPPDDIPTRAGGQAGDGDAADNAAGPDNTHNTAKSYPTWADSETEVAYL